jgi:hypothetical protein
MEHLFIFKHPELLAVAVIWSLIWKGIALWRSAKNNDKWWFIAFLVVHSLGILELIYIYIVKPSKKK